MNKINNNVTDTALAIAFIALAVMLVGGFGVTSSYGQAETTTSTVRVPFDQAPFNPCIEEFVELSGDALFVFHTTVNPDGTKSLEVQHMSTEGLKGTTESGDTVVYSQVEHTVASERGSGGVFHNYLHLTLAAQGQPNILGTFVLHTIINDDGTTKHEVAHVSLKCVGQG